MKRVVGSIFFLFLCLSVYVGCTRAEQPLSADNPVIKELKLPERIIDAHVHFDVGDEKDEVHPSEDLLKEFEETNVVGAVVHLSIRTLSLVKVRPEWPGHRLAKCAAIVPGQTVKAVEAGVAAGTFQCMKIYLGYEPMYPNDPFYHPFYKSAQKTGVPVVFHTGDCHDKEALVKYADPIGVDEIAVAYPKVTFVLAHMGNPWIQSAAEVVYKNDNVYTDTSALITGHAKDDYTPEQIEEMVTKPVRWFMYFVENPKKIMFGSDFPLLDIKPYAQAIQRAIPEEHWNDVFYQNAVDVFKLDQKALTQHGK